jgi:16S rRNA C967 or C1407 C5-methylase (RsmB/RsmF family)/NOL1/NOP2/fmu family ribosome biogenesis protein
MKLPPAFIAQMQALLGAEYAAFEAALQTPPPVSIRLNPGKPVADASLLPPAGGVVPWHAGGRYLGERPVFTLDPLFHAGAYYVQEASSMFLAEALRQTCDLSVPLRALDLCAAPGGKSTLLVDLLAPGSLLVANEVIRTRVAPLRENLEKWGAPHTAVVSAESEEFAALPGFFDVIVTDAPCSGEGLFRKDPAAVDEWSPAGVELCAGRQRRILAAAVEALAPGGVLAYSTCTYNHRENEENAAWLAREFGLAQQTLDLPNEWQISEPSAGNYHFFPHRTRGEGFFIAVFRKHDTGPRAVLHPPAAFRSLRPLPRAQTPDAARWLAADADVRFFQTPAGDVLALPAALEGDYLVLDKALKNKWFGLPVGEFKGRDLVPAHALALSRWARPTLPAVELARDAALLYLKKENFELPADTPTGWCLARYGGLNLGWLKVLPNRFNNYLPAERRIRMQL